MSADVIHRALQCPRDRCDCKRRGGNTHCPAHEDANPSFNVADKGGQVVFRCYSGCSQDAVVASLTERSLWPPESAVVPFSPRRERLVKEYEFRDASGVVMAVHGRFEGPKGKTFAWRKPDGEWGQGLGFPESDLPLYRLADVLNSPDATVWFVEGEKAADTCQAKGLVAVSLGGGANQQRFGNALDPLMGRDVVLWPDADEAGRSLMERVAGYLPHARTVAPPVPPKGDAADYFAGGGTVEALIDLTRSAEPQVRVTEDRRAVEVDYPVAGGMVRFTFSSFAMSVRETAAIVEIKCDLAGYRNVPYATRVNLASASARDGLRREIEKVFDTKDLKWARMLSYSFSAAERAWRDLDRSVDIFDVPIPEERRWLVDRWAPHGVVTIPFGAGGSGKSYIALDVALHCLNGVPWMGRPVERIESFMVIDYEDTEDEWRLRAHQLCQANGWELKANQFIYLSGAGIPLVDQRVAVERLLEAHRVGMLIVDSAVSAAGGAIREETAPALLCNMLTDFGRLGATTLLIAHNTKEEDSRHPIGSIMWTNLVRATHFIESYQADGSPTVDLTIWNRKGNRGKQRPISARITFDPTNEVGAVHIVPLEPGESLKPQIIEDGSNKTRILAAMRELRVAVTPAEIAGIARLSAEIVRTELNRMYKRGEYVTQAGTRANATLWGLLDTREGEQIESWA